MKSEIKQVLKDVQNGSMSIEEALVRIKKEPYEDIGFAKVDLHRKLRQGASEVIYGEGKTPEQIIGIVNTLMNNKQEHILITRLCAKAAEVVKNTYSLSYYENARVGIIGNQPVPDGIGKIVVATGGTSDIPVAEEACVTAEFFGNYVTRLYD